MLILAWLLMLLFPGIQIVYFGGHIPSWMDLVRRCRKPMGSLVVWQPTRMVAKSGRTATAASSFFRHCQHERDVYDYQSQQFDVMLVDEATHFSWTIIDYLLTRNRASGEVRVPGFKPFLYCSNPETLGMPGTARVFDMEGPDKNRPHEQVKTVQNPNGKNVQVYFLPALLEDNAIGVAADPDYEDRLMQRNATIARALRFGDWKIFAGQAFPSGPGSDCLQAI